MEPTMEQTEAAAEGLRAQRLSVLHNGVWLARLLAAREAAARAEEREACAKIAHAYSDRFEHRPDRIGERMAAEIIAESIEARGPDDPR